MFRAIGSAANAVILVLIIVSIGAFSLIKIEGQPIFQIMRNVMLASLGEETNGLTIQGEPNSQRLNCDYATGVCKWEQ